MHQVALHIADLLAPYNTRDPNEAPLEGLWPRLHIQSLRPLLLHPQNKCALSHYQGPYHNPCTMNNCKYSSYPDTKMTPNSPIAETSTMSSVSDNSPLPHERADSANATEESLTLHPSSNS